MGAKVSKIIFSFLLAFSLFSGSVFANDNDEKLSENDYIVLEALPSYDKGNASLQINTKKILSVIEQDVEKLTD